VVLQLYAGEQQLGDAYDPEYWNQLMHYLDRQLDVTIPTSTGPAKLKREANYLKDAGVEHVGPDDNGDDVFRFTVNQLTVRWELTSFTYSMPLWIEFHLRRCMDMFINLFMRQLVVFTFPIMLSVEGPLDFVKDCTAIWFITTLDDLDVGQDDETDIPAMLSKIGKRWAWDQIDRVPCKPRRYKDEVGFSRIDVP